MAAHCLGKMSIVSWEGDMLGPWRAWGFVLFPADRLLLCNREGISPYIGPGNHSWLLSDDVDILTFLLLPLAGPEELSEEENDGKRAYVFLK